MQWLIAYALRFRALGAQALNFVRLVVVAAFRAHPQDYDMVVTDLSMPRMSGLELARELLAVRPDMPVQMTTGYLRAEDEGNARAAGIRDLVLKPLTMDELVRVLDRLFRDSQTRN